MYLVGCSRIRRQGGGGRRTGRTTAACIPIVTWRRARSAKSNLQNRGENRKTELVPGFSALSLSLSFITLRAFPPNPHITRLTGTQFIDHF